MPKPHSQKRPHTENGMLHAVTQTVQAHVRNAATTICNDAYTTANYVITAP